MNRNNFKRLNGLNCAEYLIRGVAVHYNRNYEMMFSGSWGFNADFSKCITEPGLVSDHATDDWCDLNRFHGIHVERIVFQNYSAFKEFVRIQLKQNYPVMATVDLYWIPWTTQNYLSLSWGHMVLITGECADGWLCYDFFSTHENVIPFDHLEKCFRCAFSFHVGKEPLFELADCMDVIHKNIHRNIINTDAFAKMNELADRFATGDGLKLLEQAPCFADFKTCDLMDVFNRLSQRRSQFAIALKYLAARFQENKMEYSGFAEQFDQCAASWKSVWGMLQKAYLTVRTDSICLRVGNRLKEIAKIEGNLCNAILNHCNGVKVPIAGHKKTQLYTHRSQHVPLSSYANHKAIETEVVTGRALFQDASFILADDVLCSGALKGNSSSYELCSFSKPFDNIACIGQRISIRQECAAISILCCAEFAHQTEVLCIDCMDEIIEIPFNVTAWSWSLPEFEQKIAWEGYEGILVNGDIRHYPLPGHFYSKRYDFIKQIFAKDIILPYCPGIHIFGITLHYN